MKGGCIKDLNETKARCYKINTAAYWHNKKIYASAREKLHEWALAEKMINEILEEHGIISV